MNARPITFRPEPNPVSGLLFGLGLAVFGLLAAGFGHGTYVLIGASSAPLGVLGIWTAAAGAPALWAGVGAAFDWLPARMRTRTIALILVVHYCGAAMLLSSEQYGDWATFRRFSSQLWPLVLGWVGLYTFGQTVVWYSLFTTPANGAAPPQSGSADR